MLDWDKLRIFHTAAESGSFTHAAEKLNMSQSAVSRQISALEEDLGLKLFIRHARGLVLTEVGELASAKQMPGVVPRMMMGSTPMDRRWKAVGAGFGVAWPMNDTARLFGMVEFAVPVNRDDVQLDGYGTYEPDPLAARSSVGLELGWR